LDKNKHYKVYLYLNRAIIIANTAMIANTTRNAENTNFRKIAITAIIAKKTPLNNFQITGANKMIRPSSKIDFSVVFIIDYPFSRTLVYHVYKCSICD